LDPIIGVGVCINNFSIRKMDEEHPNLSHSHRVSTKKGNGDFGARYPNSDIEYGKFFPSNSEAKKRILQD